MAKTKSQREANATLPRQEGCSATKTQPKAESLSSRGDVQCLCDAGTNGGSEILVPPILEPAWFPFNERSYDLIKLLEQHGRVAGTPSHRHQSKYSCVG